jgi:hypothetical protein
MACSFPCYLLPATMTTNAPAADGHQMVHNRRLGFALRHSAAPAFADVTRGRLRLLLAGPESSAGRPVPDGRKLGPGGWNRIHLIVDDIAAEVARYEVQA